MDIAILVRFFLTIGFILWIAAAWAFGLISKGRD